MEILFSPVTFLTIRSRDWENCSGVIVVGAPCAQSNLFRLDMISEKYQMSFTTGGLFLRESMKVAKIYFDELDWAAVKSRVQKNNVLQARAASSERRISSEIISRLKHLSNDEIQLLLNGSRQEQVQILWLAVCRTYKFIYDFATDVLHEKFLRLSMSLTADDYNTFFNAKAQWHEELANLSTATQKRLRQVVFKIMREAEIISRDGRINPGVLTPRIVRVIRKANHSDFIVFPVHENQVRELAG